MFELTFTKNLLPYFMELMFTSILEITTTNIIASGLTTIELFDIWINDYQNNVASGLTTTKKYPLRVNNYQ